MMALPGSRTRRITLLLSKTKLLVFDAYSYYQKQDFGPFLNISFGHLGFQKFDRSLFFLVLDLDRVVDIVGLNYSFSEYSIEDIKNGLYNYNDGFFTKEKAIHRLKTGRRLYVLIKDDNIAFYLWVAQQGATIWWFNDLPIDMPNDTVYMSAVYTSPQFRNQGIASKTKREIFHYLKNKGIKRIIEVINPNNTIALKVDRRLGFKDYQIVHYGRFWFSRYYRIQQIDSDKSKNIKTLFRSPKGIWKTYLPSL